jgi:hypothetical protein
MAQKNSALSSPPANRVIGNLEGGGFNAAPVVFLHQGLANSVAIGIRNQL